MNSRSDNAIATFAEGFNCAQSVLASFCEELQLDKRTALKLACGFGGGMGRKEEVCGAVTGGILAIGAKYGRADVDDGSATEITYTKTRELMNRFAEKHGSYSCRQLLGGIDLTTDEGQTIFKEKEMKKNVCNECVGSAVEMVEKILGTEN